MSYVEIRSTERDAIDKLDTLFAQIRGKAKSEQWVATFQKTPDGVACLSVVFAKPEPKPEPAPENPQ